MTKLLCHSVKVIVVGCEAYSEQLMETSESEKENCAHGESTLQIECLGSCLGQLFVSNLGHLSFVVVA
jgi:hypothetical protein